MEYTPPLGGAANDPYIDANPGIGQAGSALPAAAVEDPQREIVQAIQDAGLLPSAADLTQLAAAIIALARQNGDPTGKVSGIIGLVAPAGYVLGHGLTIGNATSNATERANADTEALFTAAWDSMADAQAPVLDSTGTPVARGGSAAIDFGNDRQITLPDLRGRVIIGAGTGSGLTLRVLGDSGGEEAHALTEAELDPHDHLIVNGGSNNASLTLPGGARDHATQDRNSGGSFSYTLGANASTPDRGETSETGSGNAHNTMQPWLALTPIIKL